MVQHGRELLGNALELVGGLRRDIELIPDVKVLDEALLGVEASHDLDRLQILMDLSATGTSGYQAGDWLREHKQVDLGLADHRRLLATMSFADDKASGERLLDALWAWRKAANDFDSPPPIRLPSPSEIELETVQLPREAFFGEVEAVPAEKASGRISAEQITPYPPGISAVVPGERLNDAVIDYLRSGLDAGMNIPDAADTSLKTFRCVVA
jgi:lysine decarboxylase